MENNSKELYVVLMRTKIPLETIMSKYKENPLHLKLMRHDNIYDYCAFHAYRDYETLKFALEQCDLDINRIRDRFGKFRDNEHSIFEENFKKYENELKQSGRDEQYQKYRKYFVIENGDQEVIRILKEHNIDSSNINWKTMFVTFDSIMEFIRRTNVVEKFTYFIQKDTRVIKLIFDLTLCEPYKGSDTDNDKIIKNIYTDFCRAHYGNNYEIDYIVERCNKNALHLKFLAHDLEYFLENIENYEIFKFGVGHNKRIIALYSDEKSYIEVESIKFDQKYQQQHFEDHLKNYCKECEDFRPYIEYFMAQNHRSADEQLVMDILEQNGVDLRIMQRKNILFLSCGPIFELIQKNNDKKSKGLEQFILKILKAIEDSAVENPASRRCFDRNFDHFCAAFRNLAVASDCPSTLGITQSYLFRPTFFWVWFSLNYKSPSAYCGA